MHQSPTWFFVVAVLVASALVARFFLERGRQVGARPRPRIRKTGSTVSRERNPRPLDGLVRDRRPARPEIRVPEADPRKQRGAKAEFLVASVLSRTCDDAMGNLYLSSRDGITQVDHVGRRGGLIVVVETKSLGGIIEASRTDRTWTQVSRYGRRVFQNPLHQNYGHVQAVRDIVGEGVNVRGIVAVVGRPRFVHGIPAGVVHLDDLEQRIVEMSDRCRGEDEARGAMSGIRVDIASRRGVDVQVQHMRTVGKARSRPTV